MTFVFSLFSQHCIRLARTVIVHTLLFGVVATATAQEVPDNTGLRPTKQDIEKAVVLDVRFTLDFTVIPEMNSAEAYRNWGRSGGQAPWAEVPSLRSKYFTLKEETSEAGGFYTFFNLEALDVYMESDLFKSMGTFPFITNLKYTVYEVIPGTELTMDLGAWH